ncbi:MAG: tyrosine-type recombinase/integrase [Prevotella sp.]|nr:tyrosine-type recombinase/integrase [Prevotella sp.]
MINISLVYDHHKRSRKEDEGPIEVRVTVNRKPYYINTGVRVRKDRLVGNCIRDVKVKHADGVWRRTDDADVLNERLTTIIGIVEREVNSCLDKRRPIDVSEIRRKVWELDVKDAVDGQTIADWIREQAGMMNSAKTTKVRYVTLCNRLEEFGLTQWGQVTVETIYRLDAWLHQKDKPLTANQRMAGVESGKIGDAGVYSYHKGLRAMLNRAVKVGKIAANPYDRLRGEFKRGKSDKTEYLTEEQMKKIVNLTPVRGSQEAMARDLFVFQMYTGLGYADTQAFDLSRYRRETVDGPDGQKTERWIYMGERVKTGVPYVSMLLPPVVDVLERNGWRVPRMNNQRYNQMLKAIGMVIGIGRLHSHMARHTFATWMLSNDAKIENVSRMLGHTNITQTQRYARVLAKDVYDDYDRMAKILNDKNTEKK